MKEISGFRILLWLLTLFALGSCRTIEENPGDPASMTQSDFAIADADSDGKLTAEELATFQHREAMAEIDLDGDRRISRKEWAAARPSAGEDDPHFDALDRDSDGEVSGAEAVAFITSHDAFTDQFSEVDEDGDSVLHWEEIDAAEPGSLKVSLFPAEPES